jgi:catechol 2,3-dioxygenase-like lactoylglutathione lyase family enzyme
MEGVLGLDAVILIVKDIQAQKQFYRDVLGLNVIGDRGDAVFLECGQQKLGLFSRDHHAEGTARLEGAAKGISHLEFRIKKEELASIQQRLESAGFHAYRDNFSDPDGNLFHFNAVEG